MIEIVSLIYFMLIFPFCLFIPGYLISRNSRLSHELMFVDSISLSIFTIFLISFVLYILKLGTVWYIFFSLSFIFIALWLRKEILGLFCLPQVKSLITYYALFLLWVFLLTTVIRNYSGGLWSGDWEEHFQRSLFFKDSYPLAFEFIGGWLLPARPPLYNLVASFFLNHAGNQFFFYQFSSLILNSVVFLGAFIVFKTYMQGRGAKVSAGFPLLAVFLCLNPSVLENVTYPWTRSLTNFFVLYSLVLFYLSIEGNDGLLRRRSYFNMGLAALTHYSAIPYLAGLMLVDAYFVMRGRLAFKEALINIGIFFTVVSLWFSFALYYYGAGVTFGSNSTVMDSSALGLSENLLKIWGNLKSTFIPHFLRQVPELEYVQKYLPGFIRDYAFMIYQVNFLFMFGSIGWLVVLVYFTKDSFHALLSGDRERKLLLWAFLILVITVGIAAHGEYDPFGVGHICLQPLAILGIIYLAANFRRYSRLVKGLLYFGLLVDSILGVLLHFWMQHYDLRDVIEINRYESALGFGITDSIVNKVRKGYIFIGDLSYASFITMTIAGILLAIVFTLIRSRYCVEQE